MNSSISPLRESGRKFVIRHCASLKATKPYQNVCVCVFQFSYRRSPSGSAVRNHCRTHPALCIRPRCVCSVLLTHAQFCRFDKADTTADVRWHCDHRLPLWYHFFPAQSSLGADILVYWIGKIVRTCAPGGSLTHDFLCARRAPYPLGQALRYLIKSFCQFNI